VDPARSVRAALPAELGAEVHPLGRPGLADMRPTNPLLRGAATVQGVDLESPAGLTRARELVEAATLLVDVSGPAVMKPLGWGPDQCHLTQTRSRR
jgi:crotonobetainyl-CoA:carnitine CoA-transferase CaiB-like acyl-CoA transferase